MSQNLQYSTLKGRPHQNQRSDNDPPLPTFWILHLSNAASLLAELVLYSTAVTTRTAPRDQSAIASESNKCKAASLDLLHVAPESQQTVKDT